MGLQPTQGHETFGPHRFVISIEAKRSGEICGFAVRTDVFRPKRSEVEGPKVLVSDLLENF
jgi:hypothetical protein